MILKPSRAILEILSQGFYRARPCFKQLRNVKIPSFHVKVSTTSLGPFRFPGQFSRSRPVRRVHPQMSSAGNGTTSQSCFWSETVLAPVHLLSFEWVRAHRTGLSFRCLLFLLVSFPSLLNKILSYSHLKNRLRFFSLVHSKATVRREIIP